MKTRQTFVYGIFAVIFIAILALAFTACPVTKDDLPDDEIPPEDLPVDDRWSIDVNPDSTATIDHFEVNSDGVCIITVGGTPMPNNSTAGYNAWRTRARYAYTAKADTVYVYKFEAWTQSGTNSLDPIGFGYYFDNDTQDGFYSSPFADVPPTTEQQTYTVIGRAIPKGGVQNLEFQLGTFHGTIYIKVLSITEYTPHLEFELIEEYWADEWGNTNFNNLNTYRLISAAGMSGIVEIPAVYNNKPVTEIGKDAFRGTSVTSVHIPASVTSIDHFAFAYCHYITAVTFAANSQLDQVGWYVFAQSTNITNIIIPAGVKWIGSYTFSEWTTSQTIYIQGHASQQSAHNAWGDDWRKDCNANIVYGELPLGNGTFTVIGIPPEYNGQYAYLMAFIDLKYFVEGEERVVVLYGCQSYNTTTNVMTLVQIENGSVSLPLWKWDGDDNTDKYVRYSGNETVLIAGLNIHSVSSLTDEDDHDESYTAYRYWESFAFSNGSAEKTWQSGSESEPDW